MTEEEIKQHKEKIASMTQTEMASLYRFAPAGHIYFNTTLPLAEYFDARFKKLGGMISVISKEIGW